ncbi:MAG: hypothetical protein HFJ20_06035 [Clostridia bacterium]|nr:hypothetical protein [Clostridia bacterium]
MCDFEYNMKIGNNFYSNHNVIILHEKDVEFGENVFIVPNCSFYTAGHPINIKEKN